MRDGRNAAILNMHIHGLVFQDPDIFPSIREAYPHIIVREVEIMGKRLGPGICTTYLYIGLTQASGSDARGRGGTAKERDLLERGAGRIV